jgi:hypothetical protein
MPDGSAAFDAIRTASSRLPARVRLVFLSKQKLISSAAEPIKTTS